MQAGTRYKLATVLLLGLMGAHRYLTVSRPPQVDAYHSRIRDAAASLPTRIGPWVAQDTPVPAQATTLLRPNVMISRRYTNVETGLTASFVLVHCADAHDMAGHFPLRCYPAQGWQAEEREHHDWAVGSEMVLTGCYYTFQRKGIDAAGMEQQHTIRVANALLRPGNKVHRDMEDLTKSILGAGGQAAGAGQLQVVFDGSVSEGEQHTAVQALLTGHRSVIDAILAPIEVQ